MAKYTLTDSHSLCAQSPFSTEILAAKKLKVTTKLGEAVMSVNQAYKPGPRQLHVVKGTGAELFKVIMGTSKALPIEAEIEVVE